MNIMLKKGFQNKRHSGFTLIELLVVMSIISMLASVILASLNGARQKGILGSIVQFSTNNYHKLGANMVFFESFNENSPTTAVDQTGNFSMLSGPPSISYSQNTPFSDKGYSYNDVDTNPSISYGAAGGASQVNFSDTSGITTSAWFNTLSVTPANGVFISGSVNKAAGGSNVFFLRFINGPLRLSCSFGTLMMYNVPAFDSNWHNATCTYDTLQHMQYLYFDGKLVLSASTAAYTPVSIPTSPTPLTVGTSFTGLVDNIQLFAGSLTASAVGKLYAEGLKTHQFATNN